MIWVGGWKCVMWEWLKGLGHEIDYDKCYNNAGRKSIKARPTKLAMFHLWLIVPGLLLTYVSHRCHTAAFNPLTPRGMNAMNECSIVCLGHEVLVNLEFKILGSYCVTWNARLEPWAAG